MKHAPCWVAAGLLAAFGCGSPQSKPDTAAAKSEADAQAPASDAGGDAKVQDVAAAVAAVEPPQAKIPSDAELCQHIVDITHTQLQHLDELDAKVEAEALAACVAKVQGDRERFGVAFAPLAECVYEADDLAEIGLCEDTFATAIAGEDLDDLVEGFALEAPIVDAELCVHRSKIDPKSEFSACMAELSGLRRRVGNMDFDSFAWCMMDAKSPAAFTACEREAEIVHADHDAPGRTRAPLNTDASPEAALTAIEALAERACACRDQACSVEVAHALDDWTHNFARVKGDAAQQKAAEQAAARMVKCEKSVAGGAWPKHVRDTAGPQPKRKGG